MIPPSGLGPTGPYKEKRSTPRSSDDSPPTVLVVEDDAAIRQALIDAIRADGYRVETAINGLEALEKLRWGLRPCLIVLDMQMRLMTGWEFRAEQMKDPALSKIPVVAMTAGGRTGPQGFRGPYDKPIALRIANLSRSLQGQPERRRRVGQRIASGSRVA